MGLCYSILGTGTPVLQQPLTYTASILVLGESLPALHLGRSRDHWGITPGQPLSQQSPAPCFCSQSVTPYTHTWPSPPEGQA